PALSTCTSSPKPWRAKRCFMTPSAVGDRQMLPRHTKQTETAGCPGIGSALETVAPRARDDAGVDPADAHAQLADGARGELDRAPVDEVLAQPQDRRVHLLGLERRRKDVSALVAEVLRRQLPAAADAHAVAE